MIVCSKRRLQSANDLHATTSSAREWRSGHKYRFAISITVLEDVDTGQDISPTCGFRCARFSRVISQSNHGLYCESNRYNKVFLCGSSCMTRNLSELPAAAVASSLISGGGNRKLFRAVHSVTIRSSSCVLYVCCLNPDITADNVSLNDGERIIGRYVLCVK